MADAVYQALDRMVPALEDLVVRGIFTQEEVRAIAAKRRDFEFLLRRRTARKADFLRYLEYELNLDELRRLRKQRLGMTKTTKSDFSGRQLVHFIFERALRKFRGDLELWLQYLDYCQQTGAAKAHSRALAQALQLFPRQAGLWVRAASHEYFENSSPPAARVLMQRGLRLNGADSALLWTQYFKLELLYVAKLRGRRLALGLQRQAPPTPTPTAEREEEEEGEGGGACPVDLPSLPEEEDQEAGAAAAPSNIPTLDASDPRAQSVQAVLSGAVPRVVYAAAIAARPQDLDMRLDFLAVLDGLPLDFEAGEEEWVEALAQEMLDGVDLDFGLESGAWARALHAMRSSSGSSSGGSDVAAGGKKGEKGKGKKRARAGSDGDDDVQGFARALPPAEAACLAALERGVAALPGSRGMWDCYVRGLTELLRAPPAVVAAAMARAEAALAEEAMAPAMYLQWAEACVESSEREAEARRVLDKAVQVHPAEPQLWAARLRLAGPGKGKGMQALWPKALAAVGGVAAGLEGEGERRRAVSEMWLAYLRWLVGRVEEAEKGGGEGGESESESEEAEEGVVIIKPAVLARALEGALASTRGLGRVEVCALWARWQGRRGLRRALRLVGGLAMEDDRAEADAAMGALAELCLATSITSASSAAEQLQEQRDFYEAALAVCGAHPAAKPLWEAYEAMERGAGQHQWAHNVKWRASQAALEGGGAVDRCARVSE